VRERERDKEQMHKKSKMVLKTKNREEKKYPGRSHSIARRKQVEE
jgi:hypothetical protein